VHKNQTVTNAPRPHEIEKVQFSEVDKKFRLSDRCCGVRWAGRSKLVDQQQANDLSPNVDYCCSVVQGRPIAQLT